MQFFLVHSVLILILVVVSLWSSHSRERSRRSASSWGFFMTIVVFAVGVHVGLLNCSYFKSSRILRETDFVRSPSFVCLAVRHHHRNWRGGRAVHFDQNNFSVLPSPIIQAASHIGGSKFTNTGQKKNTTNSHTF
jgi:hypothetical protein